MFEVLKSRQQTTGRKGGYKYMIYTASKAPKGASTPKMFNLFLTPELLKKARMKIGDRITLDFEPHTKEAVLRLEENGERAITKAGGMKEPYGRISYPLITDFGFPDIDRLSLDWGVHTKAGVINFTIVQKGENKMKETNE